MDWSEEGLKAIGGSPAVPLGTALMRYVAGCLSRERERVARILEKHDFDPDAIAEIRSEADDAKVFKWAGPESRLDDPWPPEKRR